MNLRKALLAAAMMIGMIGGAGAAHASIEVLIAVDNQTSSAVSLSGSSTNGTFTSGPANSVAANTWATPAYTFYPYDVAEQGSLTYGNCTIDWAAWVIGGNVHTFVDGYGAAGCDATLNLAIYYGGIATVAVTLTIS